MKTAIAVWSDNTYTVYPYYKYRRWHGQMIRGEHELTRDTVGWFPVKKDLGTMLMWTAEGYLSTDPTVEGYNRFASTRYCSVKFSASERVLGPALFTGKQTSTGCIGTLSKIQISGLLHALEMMNRIVGSPHIGDTAGPSYILPEPKRTGRFIL